MTHGDMPLGWGWLINKGSDNYFVVKCGATKCFYTQKRYNGRVAEHRRSVDAELPDEREYPHFFLPVGVI